MNARIYFHGGAGSVTGANFLFDTGEPPAGGKFLIDCGTENQEHLCDTASLAPFPYDVSSISALFATHAHHDHIGRIPRLVRAGYTGPIYSTAATRDISALMYEDALSIMREHAERHGCELLYEAQDVARTLSQWKTLEYHSPLALGGVETELYDAGHILGSAMVKFSRGGRSIFFTGDLGNTPEPLLRDREAPAGATYIVMESVYGDRVHEGREERRERLREVVEEVRAQRGTLLIPSFSIERTQILLFELHDLIEQKRMAPIPVYLDSPLAARVTDVFARYAALFNEKARAHVSAAHDPFSFQGLQIVRTSAASHHIHKTADPKILIAGAGMSGGGRIRAHEKEYLGDKRATVLFVGYQAPGTLGRMLQEGARNVVIDGEHIRVRARMRTLTGYSGHADRDQLLHFIESAGDSVERVFITMGEPRASLFLAQRIKDFLGVDAVVPKRGEVLGIEW